MAWVGRNWHQRAAARRMCLATGFPIYCVRILFTEFVFLKRGVGWSEVFMIAPWLFIIVLLFGIEGDADHAGRNGGRERCRRGAWAAAPGTSRQTQANSAKTLFMGAPELRPSEARDSRVL